jgi:hypothetical protein
LALPEPLAVTLHVARTFEAMGIRYLVGGSLASSLHGVPRATHDADLLAEIPQDRVEELVASLQDEFYIDAEMIRRELRRGGSFNVIHLATMFKVDVFVLTADPLQLEEMSRRQLHPVGEGEEHRMYFATAEDVILRKLEWFRKGGGVSDRQWGDVLGVIKVKGADLDLTYLRRGSAALGVGELLERALVQAGR